MSDPAQPHDQQPRPNPFPHRDHQLLAPRDQPPLAPRGPLRHQRRHLGVRLDRELEASLVEVAARIGCTLSACVRNALRLYLGQFRDGEECRRQSRLVARLEGGDQGLARLPGWSDWTP